MTVQNFVLVPLDPRRFVSLFEEETNDYADGIPGFFQLCPHAAKRKVLSCDKVGNTLTVSEIQKSGVCECHKTRVGLDIKIAHCRAVGNCQVRKRLFS